MVGWLALVLSLLCSLDTCAAAAVAESDPYLCVMFGSEVFRQELVDAFADELIPSVSERVQCLGVDVVHDSVEVYREDGVREQRHHVAHFAQHQVLPRHGHVARSGSLGQRVAARSRGVRDASSAD